MTGIQWKEMKTAQPSGSNEQTTGPNKIVKQGNDVTAMSLLFVCVFNITGCRLKKETVRFVFVYTYRNVDWTGSMLNVLLEHHPVKDQKECSK